MAAKSKTHRASYSADADALQKKVDDTRKGMPGIQDLAVAASSKSGGGVVSDKFIEGIAAQAERDPDFRKATGVDPDRLRNGNRFVVAYGPVVDSLLTFGAEAKQLILETRKRNSAESRAAYAWMKWKVEHQKDTSYARTLKKLAPLMKSGKKKKPGSGKGKKKSAAAAASKPTP